MDDDSQQKPLGVDEAYSNVFIGVHKQAYFHRLAQHDLIPETEQDVNHLLEIGAKLALASANPQLQAAAATESAFAKANAALDEALGAQGLAVPGSEKQAEDGVCNEARQAAWELANDPVLYNSVLQLKKAEEELAAAAPDSQ